MSKNAKTKGYCRPTKKKITYTPKQARKTRQIRLSKNSQIRLKLLAKSGSNYTPDQAQAARQIRLKLHAKSGSNCTPNQAPNTCCMLHATGTQQKREKRNTKAPILYRKLCCAEKATHLKSKRKASILNFGQPRKTEGRDAYICL